MKPLDWRLYPVHPGNFSLLLLLVPDFLRNNVTYRVCKCVACIRLCFIGPCQAQQQRRSRAQIQHEEDPGSSTLTMLVVHATIRTLCPSPQKQVTRKPVVWASPPIRATWARPPSSTYSTPCKDVSRDQARWKSHFSL
jgi:hypothetical protein